MNVLALADDVTGALEVGALLGAPVFLGRAPEADAHPRRVIDVETRHLSHSEAAEKMLAAVRGLEPELIYKKTDSALRGNIAAEIMALGSAFPKRRSIFLPAYPAMGRTMENGQLLVDGVPVHLTEFASDPRSPVLDSRVARLFDADDLVSIVDAATEEDLAREIEIALSQVPLPILSGPASVARHIGRHFGFERESRAPQKLPTRCLIVNGSLHSIAREQVRRIRPGLGWVVMDFARSDNRTLPPGIVARELGRAVREKLEQESFDALVLIGGDSAFAVFEALNVRVIEPLGEIALGLPICQIGARQVVTKAGAFGDPSLLASLQDRALGTE